MNNTQLNKLNHVYKTKAVDGNGFDYYYDIKIRHDIFIGEHYRPILVEKGILIDYFKPLKKLLKDENITEDSAYKVVSYRDSNESKHISLCSITPEKAQKLIDRNIALFTQFNTKIQEKQLLDAINKI